MKSGASSNPFDDDPEDDEPVDDVQDVATGAEQDAERQAASSRDQYPYRMRRSGVKDEREMSQFFLQKSTEREEERRKPDLEELVDEDLYLTDVREAVYLAGLQNLDDAAEVLREWGFEQ